MDPIPTEVRQREARRYVKALREFYGLVFTSFAVIAITGAVNVLTSPGRWWFAWVALGMAVAVLFSALRLFGRSRFLGAAWEARQIQRYLERGQ